MMAMRALQAKELERKQQAQANLDAFGARLGLGPGVATPELATKVAGRALGIDDVNTLSPAGDGVFYDRATGRWITAPTDVYQGRLSQKEAEAAATARGRATGEAAVPKAVSMEDVQRLRKEYTAATQSFGVVSGAFNDLKGLAANPTAAGDIAFLFRYVKMLDPESVVREGEFATAQNAAGVPDIVRNLYNKAISGERLNTEQRQQFMDAAEVLYRTQEAGAKRATDFFGREAERLGVPVERVTGNATPAIPPRQAAGPSEGVVAEAARRLGITVEDAKRLLEQK